MAPLVPYQKSYYILLLIRFQLLHSLRFLVQLSCPVDAVNPIAKISPKKKEKNAKVKTSEISLVYFYLKIDRKFPFFGRQDKCHRKRRNGIGSQLMPSVCFAPSKARARHLISPTFLLHVHI